MMKMTYQEIQKIIAWNKEHIPNGDIYCEMIMQDAYDLKQINLSSDDFSILLNFMVDTISKEIMRGDIKTSEKLTITGNNYWYIKNHCYNIEITYTDNSGNCVVDYLAVPILNKPLREYKNECI